MKETDSGVCICEFAIHPLLAVTGCSAAAPFECEIVNGGSRDLLQLQDLCAAVVLSMSLSVVVLLNVVEEEEETEEEMNWLPGGTMCLSGEVHFVLSGEEIR